MDLGPEMREILKHIFLILVTVILPIACGTDMPKHLNTLTHAYSTWKLFLPAEDCSVESDGFE